MPPKTPKAKKAKEPPREFPETYPGQEQLEEAYELEYRKHDFVAAEAKYKEAHESGHPEATFNLGLWCLEGTREGFERDLPRARQLMEQAAEAGLGNAQAMMGRMVEKGAAKLEKDPKVAAEWFKKAVEDPRLSSADAHVFLGLAFTRGLGVKKDPKKALKYFKAAEKFPGNMHTYVMDLKFREPEVQDKRKRPKPVSANPPPSTTKPTESTEPEEADATDEKEEKEESKAE